MFLNEINSGYLYSQMHNMAMAMVWLYMLIKMIRRKWEAMLLRYLCIDMVY